MTTSLSVHNVNNTINTCWTGANLNYHNQP